MRWRQYTGRAHPERIEAEQPPLWPRERPRPEDRPILACADNLDFMGELPDGRFKLIVTSPPYNLGSFRWSWWSGWSSP